MFDRFRWSGSEGINLLKLFLNRLMVFVLIFGLSVPRIERIIIRLAPFVGTFTGVLTGIVSAERIINLPEDPAPILEDYAAYNNTDALNYFSTDIMKRIVGNNATRTEQGHLRASIARFMALPSEELWSRVEEISITQPYFFFHARKAGGSTLRGKLYLAAKMLNFPAFIACEPDQHGLRVPCDTYHIPQNELYAVYAAHLQWGEQFRADNLRLKKEQGLESKSTAIIPALDINSRPSNDHSNERSKDDSSAMKHQRVSCMTNLREPVSRLLSCLNYRYLRYHGKFTSAMCISEVTIAELYHLLAEEVDDFSNSCLNEPFRVFSGLHDEDVINSLGLKLNPAELTVEPSLDHLSADVFEQTLMRYAQCTPYILELPKQSGDLLAYKFPQLYEAGAFRMDKASNVEKTKCEGNRGKPTPEQLKLLANFAAYERVLYDAVIMKTQNIYRQLMTNQTARAMVAKTKVRKPAMHSALTYINTEQVASAH